MRQLVHRSKTVTQGTCFRQGSGILPPSIISLINLLINHFIYLHFKLKLPCTPATRANSLYPSSLLHMAAPDVQARGNYGQWTEEAMQLAICTCLEGGQATQTAARDHGVPRASAVTAVAAEGPRGLCEWWEQRSAAAKGVCV